MAAKIGGTKNGPVGASKTKDSESSDESEDESDDEV